MTHEVSNDLHLKIACMHQHYKSSFSLLLFSVILTVFRSTNSTELQLWSALTVSDLNPMKRSIAEAHFSKADERATKKPTTSFSYTFSPFSFPFSFFHPLSHSLHLRCGLTAANTHTHTHTSFVSLPFNPTLPFGQSRPLTLNRGSL